MTGAELDAEIECVIFGREVYDCSDGTGDWLIRGRDGEDYIIPRYSESLDEAWKVVQAMRKRGFDFVFTADAHDWWYCSFAPPPNRPSSSARAEIAPVAICQAALKAFNNR